MDYSFDSSMHIGFTFTVNAETYEEAVKKAHALKVGHGGCAWAFPDVCMGDIDLHLCGVDDGETYQMIDEWV